MRTKHASWWLAAVATAACLGAEATTLRRMSLEDLADSAHAVVRARCLGSESRAQGGQIWTWTRFEVSEAIKGSVPEHVAVRLIGGRAGKLTATVNGVPRFQDGEEVILFLEPSRGGEWTVTSWAQGTFRIHRERATGRELVTQDTAGLSLFDPATREFQPGGIRRVRMEEFRERLRAVLAQRGAVRR